MAKGKSRKWTTEEEQYVIDNYGIKTTAEIAKYLGMHSKVVSAKAHVLRMKGHEINRIDVGWKEWTEEEIEYLKNNHRTMKATDIAKELGVARYIIYNKIKSLCLAGVSGFETSYKGKGPNMAKSYKENGLKIEKLNLKTDDNYEMYCKNSLYFKGKLIHETNRHFTLQNTKTKIRETFLKVDIALGEYKLKEVA